MLDSGAQFDPTGTYRYSLWRTWNASALRACFCMLNPSTADAMADDPTIRRCIGFARGWGFGAVEIVNLFACRATRPADLRAARNPIGCENDEAIRRAADRSDCFVAAWGNHGSYLGRALQVCELLAGVETLCLGLNTTGHHRHPLYVPQRTRPVPFIMNEVLAGDAIRRPAAPACTTPGR